jgi:uncharacterized protein
MPMAVPIPLSENIAERLQGHAGEFHLPMAEIAAYCRRWQIEEFALFGSILRDTFGPASDVDVLVTFDANARWTLLDHVQMQDELRSLFARDVDLVSKRGIERSRNPIRCQAILDSAEVIYAA